MSLFGKIGNCYSPLLLFKLIFDKFYKIQTYHRSLFSLALLLLYQLVILLLCLQIKFKLSIKDNWHLLLSILVVGQSFLMKHGVNCVLWLERVDCGPICLFRKGHPISHYCRLLGVCISLFLAVYYCILFFKRAVPACAICSLSSKWVQCLLIVLCSEKCSLKPVKGLLLSGSSLLVWLFIVFSSCLGHSLQGTANSWLYYGSLLFLFFTGKCKY